MPTTKIPRFSALRPMRSVARFSSSGTVGGTSESPGRAASAAAAARRLAEGIAHGRGQTAAPRRRTSPVTFTVALSLAFGLSLARATADEAPSLPAVGPWAALTDGEAVGDGALDGEEATPFALSTGRHPNGPITLYAGPERSGAFALFARRLTDAMQGERTLVPIASRGTQENLEALISDPTAIGFAQYDNFRRFVDGMSPDEPRLEFYGDVPFCVLAVGRANGPWVLPPDELPADLQPERIDIGPEDADAATSLGPLIATAPKLSNATVEYRGGSRALSRLRQRATDILFLIEYPHQRAPIVGDVLSSDDVAFLPSPAMFFTGAQSDVQGAFVPTQISIPGDGLFAGRAEINTVCTPFGIVINPLGDPDTLDFIVSAITHGTLLDENSGFWSSLLKAITLGWGETVDTVSGWFG